MADNYNITIFNNYFCEILDCLNDFINIFITKIEENKLFVIYIYKKYMIIINIYMKEMLKIYDEEKYNDIIRYNLYKKINFIKNIIINLNRIIDLDIL